MLGITSVNYPVITQGGTLIISGAGFTGATSVTLGNVSQTFTVDSDTGITIAVVGDGTPLGTQPLVVTTGATGTVIGQGSFDYHQTVLLATGISTSLTSAVTVDLTADKVFSINVTCGTSSSSNKAALTSGRVIIGG